MGVNSVTGAKAKVGKGAFSIVGNVTVTFDPANLVDGAGATSGAIAVAGAAFGDFVLVAAPYDLQGITVTAYVSSAGNVMIRIQNESGGAIDLANGTWKVLVLRGSA